MRWIFLLVIFAILFVLLHIFGQAFKMADQLKQRASCEVDTAAYMHGGAQKELSRCRR